jgi:hypothetical protein
MNDFILIAPCGMNCALCLAYQRQKNHCPGCNGPDAGKAKSCMACIIKNCEELRQSKDGFCFTCGKFPCRRMKQLDRRYRTKYGMSMLENLQAIETQGINNFIELEKAKWTCLQCGSLLCVHREACQNCGNENKKYPARPSIQSVRAERK